MLAVSIRCQTDLHASNPHKRALAHVVGIHCSKAVFGHPLGNRRRQNVVQIRGDLLGVGPGVLDLGFLEGGLLGGSHLASWRCQNCFGIGILALQSSHFGGFQPGRHECGEIHPIVLPALVRNLVGAPFDEIVELRKGAEIPGWVRSGLCHHFSLWLMEFGLSPITADQSTTTNMPGLVK
jgi:hypothetical protein